MSLECGAFGTGSEGSEGSEGSKGVKILRFGDLEKEWQWRGGKADLSLP